LREKRVVGELLFRPLPLGDVSIDDHQLFHFAFFISDCAGSGFQDPPAAVLVAQPIFQAPSDPRDPSFARSLQNFEAIVGMDLFKNRGLRKLGWGIAEYFGLSRAVIKTPTLHVDKRDHVGGILRDDAKQFVAIARAAVRQVNPELLADRHQQQHGNPVHVGNDFRRNDRHGPSCPPCVAQTDRRSL
jgi:hypothetical protein